MKVSDCMKRAVISISSTTTIAEAASIFITKHIGLLPVLDEQGRPIGVLSLSKILTLELPDFVNLFADVDFVHDFGAVETTRPSRTELARPITVLMEPVMTIPTDCGLLRAHALMLLHDVLDLPVVSGEGKLVGIVSRVDVGTAILSLWLTNEAKRP